MPTPRFIQIHTLHTYPAALLNRDDAGLAKRLPLGNAVRTRISSQCLKRHWRVVEDQFALSRLDVPMAIRSRGTLELISKRIQESGVSGHGSGRSRSHAGCWFTGQGRQGKEGGRCFENRPGSLARQA
jgi:hypothetical protein